MSFYPAAFFEGAAPAAGPLLVVVLNGYFWSAFWSSSI
jgi:hypothetical protein